MLKILVKLEIKISINYDENYYYNSNEYFKLLNFNPDIVIIILGTNDIKILIIIYS